MTVILRENNLLFIKGHKVAGTSFEIALSKYAKEKDVLSLNDDENIRTSLGFRNAQNHLYTHNELFKKSKIEYLQSFKDYRKKIKFNNHASAKELRNILGENQFNNFFKVAIVRNPYDFIVSYYYWDKARKPNELNIVDWVKKNAHILKNFYDMYIVNEKIVVDYFIKYEALKKDILTLEKKLPLLEGLYSTFKDIGAKQSIRPGNTDPYQIFKNEKELVYTINYFFNDVFDQFEYKMINPVS